jgi:hypothetical protein
VPPRTYLTTAPGQDPSEATGRATREPRERYVPGLAAPTEPRVASRLRRPIAVVLALTIAAATIALAVRLTAAAQAQDPALASPQPSAPVARDADPTHRSRR